jgi:hypothetical protein
MAAVIQHIMLCYDMLCYVMLCQSMLCAPILLRKTITRGTAERLGVCTVRKGIKGLYVVYL